MSKTYYFAVVGINSHFADGTASLLMACSEEASDVAPGSKKGKLASMTVKETALNKGLCPGANGMFEGTIEETNKKREDGTPWLRVRKSADSKILVTKKGNLAIDDADVEFDVGS